MAAVSAKRIGRIDVGLYGHRRYLKAHAMPRSLPDLRHHALIGYDRDQAYARMIAMLGPSFTRDMFAFRSDSELAQLAALRAGVGIGACQLGIARRDRNLVPVLHGDLMFSMDIWVAIHPDLRSNRRIRLMFDHVADALTRYAESSCQDA
jgi:DNA-binding transcriptional LysR family regulator